MGSTFTSENESTSNTVLPIYRLPKWDLEHLVSLGNKKDIKGCPEIAQSNMHTKGQGLPTKSSGNNLACQGCWHHPKPRLCRWQLSQVLAKLPKEERKYASKSIQICLSTTPPDLNDFSRVSFPTTNFDHISETMTTWCLFPLYCLLYFISLGLLSLPPPLLPSFIQLIIMIQNIFHFGHDIWYNSKILVTLKGYWVSLYALTLLHSPGV